MSPSSSTIRVDPTMSVNRMVTVPSGRGRSADSPRIRRRRASGSSSGSPAATARMASATAAGGLSLDR